MKLEYIRRTDIHLLITNIFIINCKLYYSFINKLIIVSEINESSKIFGVIRVNTYRTI